MITEEIIKIDTYRQIDDGAYAGEVELKLFINPPFIFLFMLSLVDGNCISTLCMVFSIASPEAVRRIV